jgi:MFS family permease
MARAHQYPRLILALVSLPVFIGALDLTIVSAVLPEVIRSMTIEIQELDIAGWVVTGYFVSYAISMTFMGRVSDIAGRRIVYLICLVIFFVGSWMVAASPGWPADIVSTVIQWFQGDRPPSPFAALYALIAGRIVQAFGAGAMVPVSMALVADLFPPEKRALPLGIVGAVDTAGWVLGHLYGGIMVQFMIWPYLFWINLPVVAVMFGVTWWGLSGLPRHEVKGGIDWIGVTLLGLALILLNVGLGSPEMSGSTAAPTRDSLYWVTGAALVFMIFLVSQRRVRDPILNLHIFSNRNLSSASGINLLVGFCIMVGLVSVPLFINVAGSATDTMKAALVTGYLLCAFTVPMALAAIPGGWLSQRLGYRWAVVLGLAIAMLGFAMMSLWKVEMATQAVAFFDHLRSGPAAADARGTGFMTAGLALAGIGIGLTIAPIGTAVINGVGEHERGMASSLVIILRLIGMSIGMSSMTAFALRRTTILSRVLLRPEDALDLEKTARVSLEVVTRITGEMALISLGVAGAALVIAFLLRRGDIPQLMR